MTVTKQIIKSLKKGQYVLIEGVPCRVEKVTISVAGKHGAAKARLDAIGIFDGRRRSIVKPASEEIEVPIIEKKTAQVLAIVGDRVQLMDLQTYETFEVDIPEDKKGKLKAGEEIVYFDVLGRKTIEELK
jgi:translation initiation factor 5A